MKKVLSICGIIASLFACEPGDFIDLPKGDKRVCILAFNEAGVPWTIVVSPTADLNELPLPEGLPDAKVTLYEDGKFLEVLELDTLDPNLTPPRPLADRPSFFRSANNAPRPGREYKVVVEAEGYPVATARYIQPLPVEADITFEFRERKYTPPIVFGAGDPPRDSIFTTTFDITIAFTDPEGENFYDFWGIQSQVQDVTQSTYYSAYYLALPNYSPVNNEVWNGYMIDDHLISGQHVTYDFIMRFSTDFGPYRPLPEWFTVSLRTTTKEMYDYLIKTRKAGLTEYDPYAQPIRSYTNVENGLGIFGGFTPTSKQFHYKGVD